MAGFVRRSLPLLTLSALTVAITGTAGSLTAYGQSMEDALVSTYRNNPSLQAQRARVRAVDENLPQAEAGWRPTVSANGSIGRAMAEGEALRKDVWLTQRSASVTATQPLYRGGRTMAGIERSKAQIQAERARLYSTEQSVLLDAATSYLNVVRDQATLELNISNERVLQRQLDSVREQFRVGEVTRTDVSQAEARLAGAVSSRVASEGQLNSSRATFTRTTGSPPTTTLVPPRPPEALLPRTLEDVQALSATEAPNVIAAQFDENAARNSIDEVRGQLLPTVNLVGSYTWQKKASATQLPQTDVTAAQVQVTVPLYEAGSVYSQIRQAKQTAGQRRIEIDVSRRQAMETATTTFENLVSTRARITSLREQIRANEVALEGVRQENRVGSRTILDVLNAEQELLNSQVSLVSAQRDDAVAVYQLTAAVGRLTAQKLQLPVEVYDFETNFREVKDKWFGTGISDE